jgi:aminomethyltransferase
MIVSGKDSQAFLEHILIADLHNLNAGSATLSMFTTENGGIIDDCIVTRMSEDSFYVVSNAGRADVDLEHMKVQLKMFKDGTAKVDIVPLLDKALIALQGPLSATVLQDGVHHDLSQLKFMHSVLTDIYNISNCRISRCGYTGEDGFEISVPVDDAVRLVDRLIASGKGEVRLAGLGARDILRLEAGLCLYGNDISEETTPIEATLAWCISKRRRKEGGFIGHETILKQLKEKPHRKRVGLELGDSGPPARRE